MEIAIEQIKKQFGKKQVLSDISFAAQSGSCIGILGGNGCGKSTLLAILAGVLKPNGGSFLCDGVDLFGDNKKRAQLVGYIPQGTPLIEELTAYDNLRLWYPKEQMAKELKDGVLSMLGIPDFLKVRVSKMSGGMKKRLSIACAIAKHPPILLLDEPMSALDIVCKQSIKDYLIKYKNAGGILILVTHDVLELELCDRCYAMKSGVLFPTAFTGDTKSLVDSIL